MPPTLRSKGANVRRGPACQTLVTKEGTISSAAAWAGAINSTNNAIEKVGKPMPTTPLIKPANTKTIAISKNDSGKKFEIIDLSQERHNPTQRPNSEADSV